MVKVYTMSMTQYSKQLAHAEAQMSGAIDRLKAEALKRGAKVTQTAHDEIVIEEVCRG